MIECWLGVLGAGKTIGGLDQGLKRVYLNHNRGNLDYYIASNITLKIPESLNFKFVLIEDIKQIEDLENCVILFDEWWKWVDARVSMSKRNKFWSEWSVITRKRNIDVDYTEQSTKQIDKRIRKITNYLAKPSQDSIDWEATIENKYKHLVYLYTIVKVAPLQNTGVNPFKYAIVNKPYFSIYDTYEEPKELSGMAYEDEARVIYTKLFDDKLFLSWEKLTDKIDHIKMLYSVNRITAVLANRLFDEHLDYQRKQVNIAKLPKNRRSSRRKKVKA